VTAEGKIQADPRRLEALDIGRRGEDAAARLARSRGWTVEDRNLRTEAGEADLVCVRQGPDGRHGLLIEVKTSANARSDLVARVDARKQRRLWQIAELLAARLDVVEMQVAVVLCVLEPNREELSWRSLSAW
jgi:putative endonuclease